MAKNNESLKVQIEVQGHRHDFILQEDKPFILGRSPSANLMIADDSVSTEHLELLWDGDTIRVRDLESSNGSFRMPQDGPFLEAKFPNSDYQLSLRLAQVPLKISWTRTSESAEKTEVLDLNAGVAPTATKVSQEVPKRSPTPKAIPETPSKVSKRYPWALPLLLAGLFTAVAQHSYFFSQHVSYLEGDPTTWRLGAAIDLYLFWLGDLPVFAAVWAVAFLGAYLLRSRLKAVSSFVLAALFAIIGVGFSISIFVWPLLFLQATGHPQLTQQSLREMQRLESSFATHDFSQKDQNITISSKLNDLSIPLKGSSAFYTFWHNFQKQRVVGECGGLGDENWEKKRVCLVLLFALSLDAYTSIRPVYLGPTAASIVFLSSLDGVIRVLAAEGPNSENIKVFIATLEEAGLEKEALDFVKLTQSFQGREFRDLMQALLDMRLGVEKKVFEEQNSARLPKKFSLNLMGPLEMGI